MARFLLSPGVLTREVDNSQYAATQPVGNVAALVGYAEKGPFEPTIVNGTQEFVRTFGKTLADAPYLAQAAYKYFSQGESLLVTRAGDSRDPELYPQAAQYATKKIRLGEQDIPAVEGTQSFSSTTALAAGTFAPSVDFGFKVVADHRAFPIPQVVETWDVRTHELYNSLTFPNPAGTLLSQTVKASYASLGDNAFKVDYKYESSTTNTIVEEYGQGTRTGTTIGSTLIGTVYKYSNNGDMVADAGNYVSISAEYGAVALGTVDMQAGNDWSAGTGTVEDLVIEIGTSSYTVTLDLETTTAQEVIDHINTKLITAEEAVAGATDISGEFEAFIVKTQTDADGGATYIGIRRLSTSTVVGATSFVITASDVQTTLGLAPKTYNDSEGAYGTWNSEDGAGNSFSGNIFMKKVGIEVSNAESLDDAIDVVVTSPASGEWTLADIVSQIQADLDEGYDGFTTFAGNTSRANVSLVGGKITITTKLAAADGFKSIVRIQNSSSNSLIDLLGGIDLPNDGNQERPIGEAVITLSAAEKGSYGNNLVLRTETKSVQTGPSTVEDYYNIYILLDGKEVSIHQRVSWDDTTSAKFLPTLLADDLYLTMEAEDEDGDFVLERLPDGDWALGTEDLPDGVLMEDANVIDFTVGTDGWTEDVDGIITSMDTDLINALKKIYNSEVYNFNLVAAPGSAASSVQNEVQNLCETRHDCFGIIDAAPFGYGLGVKDNLNHVSEINTMNENLNSSYVGTYWPWLQDYDADNKQYVWLPPSIYALTQMVYTDNVADPWYAAAGLSRGKVTALDVEYSPTRAERDILYGDTNIINPIVKFVGEGIAIWGQKTAQRTKSALDRINIRRLMIYAEKLIARMARGFLFEQNDAANWAAFARQANAILEPIRQRRGLSQYSVVCDATTNTSDLVNQNIMAGKIFVQPTKTIEFIEVEFTINAAGDVEFSE